jgi:8-oxo-dGTP pyrophosphatase MutT (NUDIX family)
VSGLLVREGRALLISHQKNGDEYWLLPGGGLEPGEDAPTTLKREFLEELSCEIDVHELLFVTEVFGETRHIIQFIFLVSTEQQEFAIGEDPVLGRYRFVGSEDLRSMTLYPDMREQIVDYMKRGRAEPVYHYLDWK